MTGEFHYQKVLVIFSGGQDSTTCLGWARNRFREVEAIMFAYGQRHSVELEAARDICTHWEVPWKLVDISFLPDLVRSALTGEGDVSAKHPDNPQVPASFVPNRNALFLTLAHAYAQQIGAQVLVGGMCQTDYSGYPDCRKEFLYSFIHWLNVGAKVDIAMSTPLMYMTKAETFNLAKKEGVLKEVIMKTRTCYQGSDKRNVWGYGCGECPACKLREQGWKDYGATRGTGDKAIS